MKHIHFIRTASLVIAVATAVGCNSKQDNSAAPVAAPTAAAPAPGAGEGKYLSGQNSMGAPTASPQDQAAARAAAAKVLARMESGDFAAIYADASPAFQKIGEQAAFVGKFSQTRKKTGPFKAPQEVSFVTRPDGGHVLVYRLDNERFQTDRRLSFVRSPKGIMLLEGLNQHDEPKKK